MKTKFCFYERPDKKIDCYKRKSNQEIEDNPHWGDGYVYQGWYPSWEHTKSFIINMIKCDYDFIHINEEFIRPLDLICESWVFFTKNEPTDASDFDDGAPLQPV